MSTIPSVRQFNDGRPKHGIAAAEVIGINAAIYAADRYVLKRDFYLKCWEQLRDNFRNPFVFDGDNFNTNFFAHPYHGSLYYNAARSLNVPMAWSSLYTLMGSLTWEFCAENERPAVNDVFSTVFGGITFGEVAHRITSALKFRRKCGNKQRIIHELVTAGINPMSTINRAVTGELWHADVYENSIQNIPMECSITAGLYSFKPQNSTRRTDGMLAFNIVYGDINDTENNKPFDYFDTNLCLVTSFRQDIVRNMNIASRLCAWQLHDGDNFKTHLALYSHYNYFDYDKKVGEGDNKEQLLQLTEAAAIGPSFAYTLPKVCDLSQQLHLSLIMMGGYTTDYYERGYNMGSGLSMKLNTDLKIGKRIHFDLKSEYYHLFTWKGIEEGSKGGDKGSADFIVIRPSIDVFISPNISIAGSAIWFYRNSHYKINPDIQKHYLDLRMGISYHL